MNVSQVVRTLTVRSKAEGVQETTTALKGLQAAHDGVARAASRTATVTDASSKRQLSIADAYRRQTLALDDNARMQDKVAKATSVADKALQQGNITQAEHARRLTLIHDRYGQASTGARTFGRALDAANDNVRGFAQSSGAIGAVLTAFGPWGIAAAAGIAGVVLALRALSTEAGRFADEMGKLRDTAQIIDLTVAQLQALNDKGAEFALTPDKIATGLQRFTAELEEARRGEGELFTQMQRLDPQLALQFARTRDTASALDLYARAISKASAAEAASLSKAGLGRTGFDIGQLLKSVSQAGGLSAITDEFKKSGDAIDTEMIEKVRQLKREIDDMASDARNNLASVFSVATLEAEKRFTSDWLEFSRSVKNFSISGDLRYLLETVLKIRIGGEGTLLGKMGIDWQAGYKAPTREQTDTFASRFQPAIESPLKSFSMSERDSNAAQLELSIYKQKIALLGEAATASERYRLRQLEINAAVAKNSDLQGEANRALTDAKQAYDVSKLQANVTALGSAATATEQYKVQVAGLSQQLSRGEITQETFNRRVADMKTDQAVTALQNNVSALGNSATAAEQYELRVAQLRQQLERGQITQETFNRAVAAAEPMLQQAKSAAEQFGQSLVSSLMDGKSLTESLTTALDSLAKSMASSAIQSLFKGDFMTAAVQAVIAIGSKIASSLFSDEEAKAAEEAAQALAEAKQAFADMTTDITDFNAAAAGFDVSELANDLTSLTEQMRTLGTAAIKAEEFGAAERIGETFNRGVGRIIDDYLGLTESLSESGQAIAQAGVDAESMKDALLDAGKSMHDSSVIAEQGLARSIARIKAELVATLNEDINEATGRGFINDISDLVSEFNQLTSEGNADPTLVARHFAVMAQEVIDDAGLVGTSFQELTGIFPELTGRVHESQDALDELAEAAEAIAERQLSAEDRVFAALNDTSTLAGQLAAFDRTAQREREDEIEAGGEALVSLEFAQAAERFNIIKDYNDKIAADAEETAQEILAAQTRSARDIVEYINGINVGSGSTLSPMARLAAAQATYNAKLALAQVGNADALSSITEDAENLRVALKDVYASSTAFQTGWLTIQQQLLALPAVATSTDPIVQALVDVNNAVVATTAAVLGTTSAVQGTTGAVQGTTGAVHGTTGAVQGTTGAVNTDTSTTAGLLSTSITKLNEAIAKFQQAVDWLVAVVGRLDYGNNVLVALQNLQTTATAQLQLFNQQLAGSQSVISQLPSSSGSGGTVVPGGQATIDNTMLEALNRIVWNTYVIARLLGGFSQGSAPLGVEQPTYAMGGWITGGMSGVDSVRLASGGLGMPGEYVLRRDVAQPNASWLPQFNRTGQLPAVGANDNSVMSELRELRAEVIALKREMMLNNEISAQADHANRDGHAANVAAVRGEREAIRAEARHDRANPKRRAA